MHDQRCLASGEAFEKYVESVLTRHHSDYFNPDPMGRHGDGGCDGVAESGTILYACYGQRALADADRKLKKKFESDFARAGLSSKKCVRSACRRAGIVLLHGAFADSYVVLVFGWDSVVVEGWSSCFVVGVASFSVVYL